MQHLLEVVRSGASVADVTFLVNYLNHQVTDCKRVTQMLKTHVLLHRLLLDSGEEFRTQIMKMHKWVVVDRNTDSTLKCLFSIRAWKDETSMEVSGWCRTYASYLDEFVANWEDFSDFARINKNPTGSETQMRSLPADELVRKLTLYPTGEMLSRLGAADLNWDDIRRVRLEYDLTHHWSTDDLRIMANLIVTAVVSSAGS